MKTNRTVKRALDILLLIASSDRPLTSKEISDILNIPVTSAFDIIRTLLSEEFIEYSSDNSKAYCIGTKSFETGYAYMRNTSLISIVSPYVERLMQMSNATAFFAIPQQHQIVYMDKVEAPTALRTSAELGSRKNMYCTGLGKSILACYEESLVRKLFAESDVVACTANTITDIDTLLGDLRDICRRGYAIDNEEGNEGISCVACAIRDYADRIRGAISIAMMNSAFTPEVVDRLGTQTAAFALEISQRLGFSGQIYRQDPE